MTDAIQRSPGVTLDLLEIYVFIGKDNRAAAERFLAAAEQAFVDLADMPLSGHVFETPIPTLRGVRIGRIRGFRDYLIYYLPMDGGIRLLAVWHGARHAAAHLEGRV